MISKLDTAARSKLVNEVVADMGARGFEVCFELALEEQRRMEAERREARWTLAAIFLGVVATIETVLLLL